MPSYFTFKHTNNEESSSCFFTYASLSCLSFLISFDITVPSTWSTESGYFP